MAQTYIYHGSHKDIHATAPRGLLFFRDFMAAFDYPYPGAEAVATENCPHPLTKFLLRDAKFILNASQPVSAQDMVEIRSGQTINYVRETQTIRDIVNPPGSPSVRTITYDSVLDVLPSGSTNGGRLAESGTLTVREDPQSGYWRLAGLNRVIARAGSCVPAPEAQDGPAANTTFH